jgi:hypothetical protein
VGVDVPLTVPPVKRKPRKKRDSGIGVGETGMIDGEVKGVVDGDVEDDDG